MKQVRRVNIMIMVIGTLSIISGAYLAFQGQPFQEYYFSILIGVSLFGAAYYNNQKMKNEGNETTDH